MNQPHSSIQNIYNKMPLTFKASCKAIKFKYQFILILIAFLLYSSLVQAQSRQKSKKALPFKDVAEAKSYLKKQEKIGQFSGAVWVSKADKVLLNQAYGYADKAKKQLNATNNIFNIGSINKVFTAVCVMQLVDKGLILLDDKITAYIPELKTEMADEITIQHLLEMKSGLGSYWDSDLFQKTYKKLSNLEDYIPIITAYKLNAKPGTKRQYSNSGYELLGILVQRVSGKDYYEYVKENVYKKAEMTHTDAFERNKPIPNLAKGYSKYKEDEPLGSLGEGTHSYSYDVDNRFPNKGTAAGGGYSTIADLKNFVVALTNNKLISSASTTSVINHFTNYNKRSGTYRAMGGSMGINADVFYNTKDDVLIIVLSNYDPPTASDVRGRLEATFNPKKVTNHKQNR